jgi:hypothetical protein
MNKFDFGMNYYGEWYFPTTWEYFPCADEEGYFFQSTEMILDA